MKKIFLNPAKTKRFAISVLLKAGVRKGISGIVADALVHTSLRGVDSHGIWLLPHYIAAVRGGRINPDPEYKFTRTSASTGLLDADHTFGHAAGIEGAGRAVALARRGGSGHIAIYNSTHFGAAAYYALEISRHGMIGMAFTNTDALVKTYGGKRAFLGNNPIAFAAPMKGEEAFCLDMSTSVITFNKIRQLRESGKKAPPGVGADISGVETVDPDRIVTLLPVGGYKGYGLGIMVEIICSMLTGMPFGPHIPKMFEAPMSSRRFLGQFVIALRIDCFQKESVFKSRLADMANELRGEPALDIRNPVMISGDPEKLAYRERVKSGIPVSISEYATLKKLGDGLECCLK